MSYTIKKHLTKVNKGKKGDNTPEWIVVHFVGATGQAKANANYFYSTYRGASAHYFVDPKTIFQVVEDDTPAWHIGDGSRTGKGKNNGYVKKGGATNTNSIGIEGCQDTTTGKDVWHWDFHPTTVDKIEWLVRKLQKKYGIDDNHVIRHYDASGKMCPGNWQWDNWGKWWEFKSRLDNGTKQATPKGNNNSEGKHSDERMHLVEAGETLSEIARDHGVSLDNLIRWNDIEDPDVIFPETKLFVEDPEYDKRVAKDDIEQLAGDTLAGKYGNGSDRKKALGDNYDAVQKMINSILLSADIPKSQPKPKSVDELAKEVIDGKHGSGADRKKSLGSNYSSVQSRVNEILSGGNSKSSGKSINQLAKEVIDGKHGSGKARRDALGSRYDEVQKRVNQIVSGNDKPSKSIDQLAKEVIDGQHGSGAERKRNLGSSYNKVQKRVNQILGSGKETSKSIKQLADEVIRGDHGSGRDRMTSLGNKYAAVQKEVNRRFK